MLLLAAALCSAVGEVAPALLTQEAYSQTLVALNATVLQQTIRVPLRLLGRTQTDCGMVYLANPDWSSLRVSARVVGMAMQSESDICADGEVLLLGSYVDGAKGNPGGSILSVYARLKDGLDWSMSFTPTTSASAAGSSKPAPGGQRRRGRTLLHAALDALRRRLLSPSEPSNMSDAEVEATVRDAVEQVGNSKA